MQFLPILCVFREKQRKMWDEYAIRNPLNNVMSVVTGNEVNHFEVDIPSGIVMDSNDKVIVKKDYYVLCGLHYWNTILEKAEKSKFKFIKKCLIYKVAIIQAKSATTLPEYIDKENKGIITVSKIYMD